MTNQPKSNQDPFDLLESALAESLAGDKNETTAAELTTPAYSQNHKTTAGDKISRDKNPNDHTANISTKNLHSKNKRIDNNSTTSPASSRKPSPMMPLSSTKTLNLMMIAAIAGLVLVIGLWFAWLNFGKNSNLDQAVAEQQQDSAAFPAPPSDTVDPAAALAENMLIEPIDVNAEAILHADIPQDPTLIKEEIDRLNDKESLLDEQAQLLDEQLVMIKELNATKAEQIALLEAQIAQLEAQKQ